MAEPKIIRESLAGKKTAYQAIRLALPSLVLDESDEKKVWYWMTWLVAEGFLVYKGATWYEFTEQGITQVVIKLSKE